MKSSLHIQKIIIQEFAEKLRQKSSNHSANEKYNRLQLLLFICEPFRMANFKSLPSQDRPAKKRLLRCMKSKHQSMRTLKLEHIEAY